MSRINTATFVAETSSEQAVTLEMEPVTRAPKKATCSDAEARLAKLNAKMDAHPARFMRAASRNTQRIAGKMEL